MLHKISLVLMADSRRFLEFRYQLKTAFSRVSYFAISLYFAKYKFVMALYYIGVPRVEHRPQDLQTTVIEPESFIISTSTMEAVTLLLIG